MSSVYFKPLTMIAGSSGSLGQGGAPSYNYQSNQMWSQNPQNPQQGYGSYSAQNQPPHPPQSPASHVRQPGSSQMQPGMQFPGMAGMQYGAGQQGMYAADQTPRGYMPQGQQGGPAVSQSWSGHHSPPQQWWAPSQQPQ